MFCTTESIRYGNISVPCYVDYYHINYYTIYINVSLFHTVPYFSDLKTPYPKDEVNLKLKMDIDQALTQYYFEERKK